MARPSVLWARCAVPVAALVSGVLVWHASDAAFSSSTANEGNQLAAGEVTLTDDDSGSARFTSSNLKPGDRIYHCIRVTSASTVPVSVKTYVRNVTTTKGLSSHAHVTVEEVDGDGGFASGCTTVRSSAIVYNRLVANAGAAFSSYETGGGTWAPSTAGAQQLYRIGMLLHSTVPDTAQGGMIGMDVVWEARSD